MRVKTRIRSEREPGSEPPFSPPGQTCRAQDGPPRHQGPPRERPRPSFSGFFFFFFAGGRSFDQRVTYGKPEPVSSR